jgi:hypothetical protein
VTKGDQLSWSFAESPSVTEPTHVDELPASETISDGAVFVIRNHESRYLTHTFHKYAGKFIPEIPRWAFRSYLPDSSDRLVVDPFVGSGTTLVEASLVGAKSIGIDVDPLARLIAKVKVTPLNPDELAAAVRDLLAEVDSSPPTRLRPSIPTLNHWFSPTAVDDLSAIKGLLERYRPNADLYDFLFICFSGIIRRASNADNQTMKTYVSHTHPKNPENARSLFKATLTDYSARLLKYMQLRRDSAHSMILDLADARSLAATWQAAKLPNADLAVTSPPYIKSVDYIYNQMAELFWVGDRWDLDTQAKQNIFKRSYMGSDKVDRDAVYLACAEDVPLTTRWVESVTGRDARLGTVAAKYFSDTVAHFRSMSRILRPGSKYVYVVGDSTLAGVSVPTHQLIVECARTCGFELSLCFGYEIRNKHMRFPRGGNGGQVIHDWVLVFDVAGVTHGRSTRESERGG